MSVMLPAFYPHNPESLPAPPPGPGDPELPERPAGPAGVDELRPRKKRVITAARKEQNRVAQKIFSRSRHHNTCNLVFFFYLHVPAQDSDRGSVGSNCLSGGSSRGHRRCAHVPRSLYTTATIVISKPLDLGGALIQVSWTSRPLSLHPNPAQLLDAEVVGGLH